MRYVRIFLLHFQEVLQNRGRTFIWFLVSFINPLLLMVYWQGAIGEHGTIGGIWTSSYMAAYYFLLTIGTTLLIVHIEEDVAFHDIKEGVLVKYLLRPFSYFQIKCIEELPWRIITSIFGLLTFFCIQLVFHVSIPLVSDPIRIGLAVGITLLGLGVSYVFKMSLALLSFWTTDFWGILSIEEMLMLLVGGVAAPLTLYPPLLEQISYMLPIAYILYFPVIAFQGLLNIPQMVEVILVQIFWIILLYGIYRYLWSRGIRKFTGVGQ